VDETSHSSQRCSIVDFTYRCGAAKAHAAFLPTEGLLNTMSLSTRRPTTAARCLVAGALVAGLGAIAAAPATAAPVPSAIATSSVAAEATAEADPVEDYIYWVYQDLLGRDVDAVGMQGWSDALHAGTPRIAVANAITASDEFRANLIAGSFLNLLEREPDEVGARDWLQAMRAGATIQQLEAGILASQEYMSATSEDDAGWVADVYSHILGREAGDAEIETWTALIAEGGISHAAVAHAILNSDEALTPRVDEYYQYLLERAIDPTGAREWVAAIQAGARLEQIIGGILASDEYYNL
jgi:Domain of unknown function (DUF4214)